MTNQPAPSNVKINFGGCLSGILILLTIGMFIAKWMGYIAFPWLIVFLPVIVLGIMFVLSIILVVISAIIVALGSAKS